MEEPSGLVIYVPPNYDPYLFVLIPVQLVLLVLGIRAMRARGGIDIAWLVGMLLVPVVLPVIYLMYVRSRPAAED